MPKPSQRVEFNTFVKGLITEASPLAFPPNASLDEENFVLNLDGTRNRRLGIDFESGSSGLTVSTSSIDSLGRSTFKWTNVGGNPNKNFVVNQVGNVLYCHYLDNYPISSGYIGSITLSNFLTTVSFSMAVVEGLLVVVANSSTIAIISCDPSSNALSVEYKVIKVRDIWGIQESDSSQENDPRYRSAYQYDSRMYNLCNQSWGVPRMNSSGTLDDPIFIYFTDSSGVHFPSDIEQVWQGLQFRAAASSTEYPSERMYATMFDSLRGSGAVAAKGYFIIDLLSRGTSRYTEYISNKNNYSLRYAISPLPLDYTSGGASVVSEFSGRVFFSGFQGDVTNGDSRSPVLSNYVAFSQLVKNKKDIPKCYQEGDPTSRDSPDVVDTDGGLIKIAGAQKILALRNMGAQLIVFCSNGIWAITGGGDYGFSATNYKVSQISNIGCISPTSVVKEGDRVYYMSDNGIYVIGKNQMGEYIVDSISASTIQSYYDSLSVTARTNARGIYDIADKKIRWIYRTEDTFNTYGATYELIFDTRLSAFSRNKIFDTADKTIKAYGYFLNTKNDLKFITIRQVGSNYNLFFSEYRDTSFTDWNTSGAGVDAKAYIITGQFTGKDSSIQKQVPYLTMFLNRTELTTDSEGVPIEQSSCLVRSMWDWADSIASNKWGPKVQAYRYRRAMFASPTSLYDNGQLMVISKNKLRGRGRAISIYMETEPNKDCQIVGWSLSLNGNETV